jgi:hypothetical protein
MKLSEKIDGRIGRQGWFRVGGVLILAIALASVQAPAQQLATPLATAGESLIAPELAQAHPVIAQYHWSKLLNHAGKPKYGGTLHLDNAMSLPTGIRSPARQALWGGAVWSATSGSSTRFSPFRG